jgi:hypothetical protein
MIVIRKKYMFTTLAVVTLMGEITGKIWYQLAARLGHSRGKCDIWIAYLNNCQKALKCYVKSLRFHFSNVLSNFNIETL